MFFILQLKGFAKHQALPNEWNDDIKGYAWDSNFDETVTSYLTIIAIVGTVVLAQTIILQTIGHFTQHLSGKRGPTRLLIWTAADSLSLLNLIVLASEAMFWMYLVQKLSEGAIFKFVWIVLVLLSSILFGIYGIIAGPKLPTAPVFSSFNCFMFLCCCICACIENRSTVTKQRLAYCSLFFNYALFMNLLSWTAIPSILFLIVYPLEALSAVSLLCCICLMYFSIVAACRSIARCALCSLAIFFIIMICLMIIHIYIIASGVGINAFSLSVMSIVPSVATALFITRIKKAFSKEENAFDEDQTETEASRNDKCTDFVTVDIESENEKDK